MAALNRLSQRIKENFQETTRDFSLLSGSSSSATATYFDASASDDKLAEISTLLESRHERERLEGMKRIIAGISRGRDMEMFFAKVVKNVVAQSIEIRKLVYIYLLRFSTTNSDLLLLSINTFQKDLSDPSPLIRSMSLRVLTSIRVPVIQGIVMLGLKKLVNDRNPWVRKTVAGGLSKVYEVDNSSLPSLIPLLQTLLASRSPLTLGATLTAFSEICPDRLDLLHPYYRHICRLLMDADEWGQAVIIPVVSRYCRIMLERPNHADAVDPATIPNESAESDDEFEGVDVDLALFLDSVKPLFQSRNPAVVLAASKAFYHLAPARHKMIGQPLLVQPMMRLCGAGGEVAALAWDIVAAMMEERPWLFRSQFTSTFLYAEDSVAVKLAKLRAMSVLVTADTADAALREIKHYIRLPETAVAEESIRCLGILIRRQDSITAPGISTLMRLLRGRRESLVAQAVLALKSAITSIRPSTSDSDSDGALSPQRLVARLARQLPGITSPHARASVFWLVGQYAAPEEGGKAILGLGWEGVAVWVPDVLRQGVKGFADEANIAKLQILTLATRVLVLAPPSLKLSLLTRHLFTLARYDRDYDVRDRARLLASFSRGILAERAKIANLNRVPAGEDAGLADGPAETEDDVGEEEEMAGVVLRREQVKMILFGHRRAGEPLGELAGGGERELEVGSLSRVMKRRMMGYEDLPEWTDDPTDPSLRDSEFERPRSAVPTAIASSSSASPYPAPLTPAAAGSYPSSASAPVPVHLASARPGSTTQDNSPAGSVPAVTRSKFQDLDAFLNSESESEEEESDVSEAEGEAHGTGSRRGTAPAVARAVLSAPPRRDIVPEYDEYEDDETDEDEKGSESDDSEEEDEEEDVAEKQPLRRNF